MFEQLSHSIPAPARNRRVLFWLLLVLVVVASIRVRLLDMPLERDEGEFAYGAQMLIQGISPYQAAYNVTLKLPGTCVAYAFFMALFGQTATAIHLGALIVNLATTILIFIFARRIFGDGGGVIAAGTFAILSLLPMVQGLAAHATHFVMLPAIAGVLLLQNLDGQTKARTVFCAGLFFGLATLMKQTGAAFGIFAAAWIFQNEISGEQKQWPRLAKRLLWLALGGLLPLALTIAAIAATGDFHQFWFWTVQYAAAHEKILGVDFKFVLGDLSQQFMASPALWSMAIFGFVALFFGRSLQRWKFFLGSFSIFSFLAVCPGWYLRGHYFIQFLPAAGLLVASAFCTLQKTFSNSPFPKLIPTAIVAVTAVSSLIQWNEIYFRLTPAQACREIYDTNPFPEAVEISRYLESRCPPDAKILVMGSEPEIYFYSHRRAATGYICTYPLVEEQPYATQMADEMAHEVEQSKPLYVVYVNVLGSWFQSTAHGNPAIFDWFNNYRQKNLKLVGFAEIKPDAPTQYRWSDENEMNPDLGGGTWVAIFKAASGQIRQP